MAGGHVFSSGALVVLLAAGPPGMRFVTHLPPVVPDLGQWTKASGSLELENSAGTLQYELYYSPSRSNYEVIRYRISGWSGGGQPYSSNERLQWQATQKDPRRFECEPRQAGGCSWRELDKSTAEYRREVPIIIWVLSVHNQLLHAREGAEP